MNAAEELNQQVVAAHNPTLIETAECAFLLLTTGELIKRRCGKIYCSPHNDIVVEHRFISDKKSGFRFAEEGDGFTYAILTKEDAYAFRAKMAEIASAIIKSIAANISARVAAAHNELHKEEVWVHHLYNDGEITMEKGGDLYGHRNRHVHTSGCRFILQKGFRFPIPARNNSYAILSEEECIAFRAEMVDLC